MRVQSEGGSSEVAKLQGGRAFYDAAEIDKEIINTRLKQDVLEHSGKIHLFVADSVRTSLLCLELSP